MASHIAVTTERILDPRIAIAACRAGEMGILDLGCHETPDAVRAAVATLSLAAGQAGQWGVRWDTLGSATRGLDQLSALLPRRVPILVLAGLRQDDLSFTNLKPTELVGLKKKIKRIARKIFVEVYDLRSALAAEAAGCDGLIVKGHEAGGWVSRHSSFVLLQELRGRLHIPYWIQGGMGVRTAPAAMMAGAAGVVLCEQLWLAEESPFAGTVQGRSWAHLDGTEMQLIGPEDRTFRLFSRSGRARLQELEQAVIKDEAWQDLLLQHMQAVDDPLIPMGEDIALAGHLASHYGTVGRILAAVSSNIDTALQEARSQQALAPDSPLARIHRTRYPIVQGPMTRVSDVAPFAKAVADAGGLPFMALSVMRQPQVRALLTKTKAMLGDQPWGIGLLGFMPVELRQEQLEVVRELKPPFAIIAGGRPGQARELEALGISTYLHVPSPGLLQGFIKDGARKFVFEGGECGGHTGPLTSFILWELAIETLSTAKIDDPESVQVLFAGGIHDAWSAAMVSALAAPLVARGMKIGVVMGTAYLFTKEIVHSGAILQEFQTQAITCKETTLLQSGKGMYTRCAVSPFCDEFNRTRRELLLALEAPEKVLKVLELLNIGRLRIASKGISHNSKRTPEDGSADRYLQIPVEAQRREGMYMLGEVARLRNEPVAIADLHTAVSAGCGAVLAQTGVRPQRKRVAKRDNSDSDIAIVGMACLFPGASDLRQYWQNILQRVNAIREVSEDRWRPEDYFDPRRGTPDMVYSKWGGFLDDVQFDPSVHGIPPASLRSIEPMQLLALDVARQALKDAGFDRHPFPRERTATIFANGGMNDLGTIYIFRTLLAQYLPKVPGLDQDARKQIMEALYEHELPKWTEDSFPGILANVTAGRVANRLDLRGANYTVDAACASSLAALDAGIKQLRSHDADVALVGAVDGTNNSMAFMCFAQTHALSPRGRCRPFDDSADGIALGEGVATLVLKRLGDAERDGDRIYAVIKGIGSSSDGRNRSLTAPHPQGQVTALRRAYEDAGVEATSVGLIEAHGTGTAVGDKSEIDSLDLAFGNTQMAAQSCAVGSVKSMIGHTKVAAGLAGMIKAALALKHRVLPPTIGVEQPNSRVDFSKTPFFINTETRPWLDGGIGQPRRGGVSAFGFGGTNFHVVLEEYTGGYRELDHVDLSPREAEPFSFRGQERAQVVQEVEHLLQSLEHPEHIDIAQLALSLHAEQRKSKSGNAAASCRLAVLANSAADLKHKLGIALKLLAGSETEIRHPQGIYYREGAAATGSVCFLFPGQGSQRVNMLRDLVSTLPALHGLFERADALLADRLPQALSRFIYPVPVFSDEARTRQQIALNATQVAQPALGVVELAALEVLKAYGITPDFVAGHSYGEYVALHAAGVISTDDFLRLSEIRGRLSAEASECAPGSMAAVDLDEARVKALIERHSLDVSLANLNAPDQTILAGSIEAIDAAAVMLGKEGVRVTKLPVTAAFHSPAMESACQPLAAALAGIEFKPGRIPVFSNTSGEIYPESADEQRALLVRHFTQPVRFVEEIEHLYEAGARVFVEVGPGLVLSGLADRILGERSHAALGVDVAGRSGWLQLAHVLGQLFALGLPVDFGAWFKGRGYRDMPVAEVVAQARAKATPNPLIWRVNGGRAEPWNAARAEPRKPVLHAVPAQPAAPAAASSSLPSASPASADDKQARQANPRNNSSPFTPHERYTMANDSTLRSADDPPLEFANPSSVQVTQIQNVIGQFIALQRDQQETLRQLLAFESRLVGVELQGVVEASPVPAMPRLVQSVPAPSARTEQPVAQAAPAPMFVAPAPVLPAQVMALRTGAVGEARVQPAASAVAPHGEAESARPKAAAPAAPAKAGGAPVSVEQFKADLLQAVSERTGYPEEMLDLNAHMEADLGIDSIKRIEVLSKLKDHHNLMEGRDEEAVFEELAGFKTLAEIVNWYGQLHSPNSVQGGAVPAKKSLTPLPSSPVEAVESHEAAGAHSAASSDPVQCHVLHAVPAPLAGQHEGQLPAAGLPVLLVGPDSEVSERFRSVLGQAGCKVKQVIPGVETQALDGDRFEFDWSSIESAQLLQRLLGNSGPAAGTVVSLLGLQDGGAGGEGSPEAAKALFVLCKVLEQDLKAAADSGAGWLINLTALDGQFGLQRSRDIPAASAGTLGVAKSVAKEWGELRVKCVDVAPALAPDEVVAHVLDEWRTQDPELEVGYTQEGRWKLELSLQDAAPAAPAQPVLDGDSVVLMTGGAYGVTAEIALALAKQYRPRLVLLGRSPLPDEEAPDTRDLTDPAQLKKHLIGKLAAAAGGKVKPAEVDRVFKRLLKDREIRAGLDALRATGAELEYHSLDVRDAEGLGRLIDQVYEKWGRIDGVIHGAGIIDDKLIHDKSPESFASVYDTKVIPALVMARKLRPEGLKFIVFFSSIAGRFGNAGQTDYSAANEVLNKLADRLSHAWPGTHALAANWGPWNAGMVRDEILKFYEDRGILPIPLASGTRHCLEQIQRGASGEPEVVITASLQQIAEQLQPKKRRGDARRGKPAHPVAESAGAP